MNSAVEQKNVLYTYKGNFRTYQGLIAAGYSGATVRVVSEPPDFVLNKTNKSEDFLKKFPTGKVPAFESSDGLFLFDSNAIAYYLANDDLRGHDLRNRSEILQWSHWAEIELIPAMETWVYPYLGVMDYDEENTKRAIEVITNIMTYLNSYLQSHTYLVGERISLADIILFCDFLHLFETVIDPEFRKPYVNVLRWFNTLLHQPNFAKVVGEFKFCEKRKQPEPVKKAEKQTTSAEISNEAADEDLSAPPAEKEKDPLAALPKGTFDMEDFKRVYSNQDTLSVALPYFWEKFDPEHYSVWFCEYKYPEELKLRFMTANLVSGMMQRLDKLRKHAFASVCIFGVDNKNTIAGVWIWRGHELVFPLRPDWSIDYESYTWKKLDVTEEEDKERINAYLLWEVSYNGMEFAEGKIFK